MKPFLIMILFSFWLIPAFAQKSWDGTKLVIQNDKIERIIELVDDKFYTTNFSLKSIQGSFSAFDPDHPHEFSFLMNDSLVSAGSRWKVENVEEQENIGTKLYNVYLQGIGENNKALKLQITYAIYPNLPIIRKKMILENVGSDEIKVEALDIEQIMCKWGPTYSVTYQKYGRYRHLAAFIGDWDDPAVLFHDENSKRGFVLGNESPGVLKRTSTILDGRTLTIGLTHTNQEYPFRVWIEPGEKWESPWVFTGLYKNENPREIFNTELSDFVRKHMGVRLAEIPKRPTFVYNTWKPFRREIDEKLILELADAAAACGAEEFVIDDGWQVGFGDWEIDYKKFPNGLKPVFDYIKSKGMKPGLWLSMGAASTDSKVYTEHPEWFVKYKDGEHANLHSAGRDRKSACFTTGWKDYIKGKILGLVKEHGLEYVKLDFAIVASAYRYGDDVSGCYAENHSHKDREESFLEIYRRAWLLFDELHAEAPNLFIDCTFETMGALQMIDYDMCKHAEGNWLSNFEGHAPTGSERVRQMAWWRSPAIPATALVIGNQSLDDDDALFSYKSLCGSLPIMLGDPRKMEIEKQRQFKAMSSWMREMEEKHNILLFRQDLPGFGEPTHGSWDGFQRINTETKSGGIIGVFKQFSNVDEHWVTINYLDKNKEYKVMIAPSGKIVAQGTGEELRSKGFKLLFEDEFQGELFEVSEIFD